MVSLDQGAKIAALMLDGFARAPSKRLLIDHKIGEPILMVRDLSFVLVEPSGAVREPSAQEIAEW